MTKKDYELIAKALNRSMPTREVWRQDLEEVAKGWTIARNAIAADLKNSSPLFKIERFLSACGDTGCR